MSTSAPALTADSTLKAWLAHPAGAEIIGHIAQQSGMDDRTLAMFRGVSLRRLVAMSGRPDGDQLLTDLVTKINNGSVPGDSPVAGPEWQERITPGRFAGSSVIVTGAASGIGRAVASRVAREGGRVIAVDLAEDRLTSLAHTPDTDIHPVAADITDQSGIARILDAAQGRIDALANVAGVLDDFSPIHEVDDRMLQRVFDVNVFGLIRLTRAVVPLMLDAGKGSIVNIASEAALRGSSAGLAYTASKHAVVGITRSTAFMYEPVGIRVNAVAPGGTLTGMRPTATNEYGQTRLNSHTADIPIAVPEALAAAITYLLSDDAVNVTGAILPSDGGESVF